MIIPGYGMPLEFAVQLMAQYILEKKGINISIKVPKSLEDLKLFESMIPYVFNYYNIVL
jgi:hypothetical protein